MSYPAAVSATQAVLILGGIIPVILGGRRGIISAGSVRWMRREDINLRAVWIGMIIWSAGVAFGIAAAVIWHSLFLFVVWVLIALATVWMIRMLRSLQRQIADGTIHDHADELRRRNEFRERDEQ
jgi:cobalamin biosynthesis protein CobD/CbiB